MNLKSRKNGISLISLIITIIVIIILAAIVIFSGMNTPEKAQLSKVISDIDNVQTAVDQAYYGLYTEKAVAGEVWTKSQFYEAVATGKTNREDLKATGLVEITEDSLVKINLPVYEGRKWYIAVSDVSDTVKTGSAVLSPGFESQGKTYATLLDIQTGGSDGAGSNGGNNGGQESLAEEDKALLASIKIGDYVNYMGTNVISGEGMSENGNEAVSLFAADGRAIPTGTPAYWRVIDKDEETGEILITTSDAVGRYELYGAEDYMNIANNTITKLDQECASKYTATGATSVRSMKIEDMDKLCRRYPITGENAALSIGNLPLDDLDALAQLYGDEYGRYAYYASNTPDDEVVDVSAKLNGKTVVYKGIRADGYMSKSVGLNSFDDHIFLTYDIVDAEGNVTTYTANKLEESEVAGDGGYKVVKEGEPVLVTMDIYGYYIPDEVEKIIGANNSWLASACVIARSGGAYFNVRDVVGGVVFADDLYYSGGDEGSYSLGLRPVVSLSSKLLEEGSAGGDVTGEYKVWKLK